MGTSRIVQGELASTTGVVLNSGPRARKSLRQDLRARGPLFNTHSNRGSEIHVVIAGATTSSTSGSRHANSRS